MFDKSPTAPSAGQYTSCGELIEDDGFVTVYPDLTGHNKKNSQVDDNLPTP